MNSSLPLPDRDDQRSPLCKRSKDDLSLEKQKPTRETPAHKRAEEKRRIGAFVFVKLSLQSQNLGFHVFASLFHDIKQSDEIIIDNYEDT